MGCGNSLEKIGPQNEKTKENGQMNNTTNFKSPINSKNGHEKFKTPNMNKSKEKKGKRFSHIKDNQIHKSKRKSEVLNNNLNLNNENIDEVLENLNNEEEEEEDQKSSEKQNKKQSKVNAEGQNMREIAEISVNSSELGSSIHENNEELNNNNNMNNENDNNK